MDHFCSSHQILVCLFHFEDVQQMLLMASPRVQQYFLKLTHSTDQVTSGADDTNMGAFHSHTSAPFFPLLPLNKKQYCSVYSNMLQYVHT